LFVSAVVGYFGLFSLCCESTNVSCFKLFDFTCHMWVWT